MIFDKATKKDIGVLTDLRIAYLNEDLGVISDENLELMKSTYQAIIQNISIRI